MPSFVGFIEESITVTTSRLRVYLFASVAVGVFAFSVTWADIKNWRTGETIPGTEGIVPGPGLQLAEWKSGDHNLRFVDFSREDRFQLAGQCSLHGAHPLARRLDQEDLRIWVKDLKRTWFGHANLDGEFDSLDIVSLLQAGKYLESADESTWINGRWSTWATGDWNADGRFDQADLILTLQDGGYGQGPLLPTLQAGGLAPVPEPSSLLLLGVGPMVLASRRYRVGIARQY